MKKFNKNIIIVMFLLAAFIFFSVKSYAETVNKDLSESLFRLHVIANSDSEEDQNLKYKVRDSLLNYMNTLSINSKSKDETINIALLHLDEFEQIAEDTIRQNGYDYSVEVEIGNYSFPTKSYGDISLPSGYYDALRVKIGKANGHNWWCVMFPPLCFVDVTSATVPEESKDQLKQSLSNEEYDIISQNSETSEVKFKIVELFNSLASKLAQK